MTWLQRSSLFLLVMMSVMSVLLVGSRDAHAAVVHDGQTLSIDLSEARICFVSPTDLHVDDDCVGLPTNINPPNDDRYAHIAAGIVRTPGSQKSPRIFALLHAYRIDTPITREITNENVHELGDQILVYAPPLPSGVTRRPLITRLEKVNGMPVIRITMIMDGYPPIPDAQLDAAPPQGHIELVGIPTSDATYFVEWMTSPRNSEAIAHLADAALLTVKVDPKKAPRGAVEAAASSSIFSVSPITIGVGVVLLLIIIFLSRGKARRRMTSFHAELWPPHDD